MNKRLIWNFELDTHSPAVLQKIPDADPEPLRWEIRCFWPENTCITLHGLDDHMLDFSQFKVKQRSDSYYLLRDKNYNIKQRRGELFYKPLLEETELIRGFGAKINLMSQEEDAILPGVPPISAGELRALIKKEKTSLQVEKTACVYKFPTQPTIKLELARLKVNNSCYFSACIEGHSQTTVEKISDCLFRNPSSCDYVRFLKRTQMP